MRNRLLPLAAGLLPALAVFTPVSVSARLWVVAALGMGGGIVLHAIRRQRFGTILLGAILACTAGLLALEGHSRAAQRAQLEGAAAVDLTQGPMPTPVPNPVTVTGHFHQGWILDEYGVEPGERPDQSQEADAVLVPFVGLPGEVMKLDGPIVIARVEPARASMTGPQTITGTTTPAPAEILDVLVRVAGVTDSAQVSGVIVDTLARPRAGRPWLQLVLAVLAAIAAVVVYSVAMHRPS